MVEGQYYRASSGGLVSELPESNFGDWAIKRCLVAPYDLNLRTSPVQCVHTRQMGSILSIGLTPQSGFHRCVCNEYDAITKRHVVEQQPCSIKAMHGMVNVAESLITLLRGYALGPLSVDQVIATRPARMRKRYENVKYNTIRKSIGKSFIKFEKHDFTKWELGDSSVPRLIQYMSSEYTLALARYTVVMEDMIKFTDKFGLRENQGFTFVSKGLNAQQKATLLRSMWDRFERPVAHLIDHSRFDSMWNEFHHLLERYIMVKSFGDDKKLDWLYSFQQWNKYISQNGIKYTFPYRRPSGVPNTGLGNCLGNYCILKACYPASIIIVDGDDAVVFTEHGTTNIIPFSDCGMITKHEVTDVFEHIEYCQSRPVETRVGWVMCRNPMRAISRMNVRLGQFVLMKDYLWTVGIGEGLASAHMPIISVMAKQFRKHGQGGRFKPFQLDYRIRTDRFSSRFDMPDELSRSSFAIAWGINVDEQLAYERRLASSVLL